MTNLVILKHDEPKINEDITKALQLMKSILSGSSLPTIQDSSIPTTSSNGAEDGQPMSANGALNSSSSASASNSSPEIVAQLAQEIYNQDLLKIFLLQMRRFEFESRKDVVNIFNLILRRQIGTRWPTVDYLANREEIIWIALKGFVPWDIPTFLYAPPADFNSPFLSQVMTILT